MPGVNICDPPDYPVALGGTGIFLNDLSDVVINIPTNGQSLVYNSITSKWENQNVVTTDELIKITAADTTPGYLSPKLVAGTNILLTVQNPGANENILIDATGVPSAINDLADVIITGAAANEVLTWNGAAWVNQANTVDKLVAVSGADTTPGNLLAKISAGTNISLAILNPGGDEDLEISVTGMPSSIDDLSDVDTTSTPPNVNDLLKWNGVNWVPGTANDDGDWLISGADVIAVLGGNVLPNTTGTQDLGSATKRWNDIYLSSKIDISTNLEIVNSSATVLTFTTSGDVQMKNNQQLNMANALDTVADHWQIYANATDDLVIFGNGTTRIFAQNANNYLGIGEIDPSYAVDIYARIRVRGDSSLGGGVFFSESSADTTNLSYIGRGADGDGFFGIQDIVSGDWYLNIFDNGNVSITPSVTPTLAIERLEVDGAIVIGNSIGNAAGTFRFAGGVFEFNTDGTGGGWVDISTANSISGSTDAIITALANGDILQYNGANWVNTPLVGLSALNDLSDVFIGAPSSGQLLSYTGATWANITLNIGDVNDVALASPSSGQALVYNGAQWVNQAVAGTNTWEVITGDLVTHNSLTDPNILPETSGTQDIGSTIKRWDNLYLATAIDYGASLVFYENTTERFKLVSGGTVSINNAYTLPNADGTTNQTLITNGAGIVSFGALPIDALSDVDTTTSAPGVNDSLKWDGSNWVPFTLSSDHGALAGLVDDDHAQYALLAGRAGGQTQAGGAAAGEDLIFQSTSNATKGSILFGISAYDEVNDRLGIGISIPTARLEIEGAGTTSLTQSLLIKNSIPTQIFKLDDDGGFSIGLSATRGSFTSAMALGTSANAGAVYTLALGDSALASFAQGIAIGRNAAASNTSTISIGYNSDATNQFSVSLGYLAQSIGLRGVALGPNASANAGNSISIGYLSVANGANTISIGDTATVSTTANGIAIGGDTNVSAGGLALMANANSTGNRSIAIGQGSVSSNLETLALGYLTEASASRSMVIGGSVAALGNLINNIQSSLIIGINSDTPTMIITGGNGIAGTLGNVGIGITTFGTSAVGALALGTKTAPSTSPVDGFQLYSADIVAGNAAPHLRTEAGDIIKLYKEAALTTALTQITHTGPTTPDYVIATPVDSGAGSAWGFSSQDEFETTMSVILNLQTRIDELETRLQNQGLLT